MLNETYMKRYKKSEMPLPLLMAYSDNSALKVKLNEVLAIDDEICECLVNPFSYRNKVIASESDMYFMSEADLKTYPSKKLKGAIFSELADSLGKWQLEAYVKEAGKEVNVLEKFYLEKNYDNDTDDKIAGNVQIAIPILKADTRKAIKHYKHSGFMHTMMMFGYDLANEDIHQLNRPIYHKGKAIDADLLVLQFEARFQTDEPQLNKYLYHITTSNHKDKILKFGISPKSKSKVFSYKDRVYLFNTDDMKLILEYAQESLKMNVTGKDKSDRKFTVFQIDSAKLKNKLYIDNHFKSQDRKHPNALFTYTNVRPEAIVKAKDVELKPKKG